MQLSTHLFKIYKYEKKRQSIITQGKHKERKNTNKSDIVHNT